MTIRITGMNSGLDTDAIIQELVKAKSTKVDTFKKEQTKLSYKQDAWKSLNSKIYSFFSKSISNMRYQSAYIKKSTSVSNANIASVVAGNSAVNGSQSLVVKQLARSGYLTGGKLDTNGTVNGNTKLSELDSSFSGNGSVEVKVGGKTNTVTFDENTTISSFVSKLSAAGVNASFDKENQRIFVSVTKSGVENDFSLTASDSNGLKALSALGLVTGNDIANNAEYKEFASYYDVSSSNILATLETNGTVASAASKRAKELQSQIASLSSTIKANTEKITKLQEELDKITAKEAYTKVEGDTSKEKLENANNRMNEISSKITEISEKLEYKALSEKDASALTEAESTKLADYQAKYGDVASIDEDALKAERDTLTEEQSDLRTSINAIKSAVSQEESIAKLEDANYDAYKTISDNALVLNEYYQTQVDGTDTVDNVNERLEYITLSKKTEDDLTDEEKTKLSDYESKYGDVTALNEETLKEKQATLTNMEKNASLLTEASTYAASLGKDAYATDPSKNLVETVQSELVTKVQTAYEAVNSADSYTSGSAVRVMAQDAVIELNGAEFTSDTNSFKINELTITAKQLSTISGYETVTDASGNSIQKAVYEETSINTTDNIDGVYSMITGFIKSYNELIKELDTMYNADSAKGYDPLTDDEKSVMTDDQIDKWEDKIKGAVLRKDSELGSVIDALKTTMLSNINIGGVAYNLSSFGIETLGYFASEENERGVYHIDGNPDDATTASEKDVLKSMLASDPDTVQSFFSQLSNNLYDKLNVLMKSTQYSSVYTVYEDKRMKTEYSDYDKKIAEAEEKLKDLEDRYYKQFSAMETALGSMNSQSSYFSSLLG